MSITDDDLRRLAAGVHGERQGGPDDRVGAPARPVLEIEVRARTLRRRHRASQVLGSAAAAALLACGGSLALGGWPGHGAPTAGTPLAGPVLARPLDQVPRYSPPPAALDHGNLLVVCDSTGMSAHDLTAGVTVLPYPAVTQAPAALLLLPAASQGGPADILGSGRITCPSDRGAEREYLQAHGLTGSDDWGLTVLSDDSHLAFVTEGNRQVQMRDERVSGAAATWVEDIRHAGRAINLLVWTRGRVLLALETTLPRDAAIRLAESVAPTRLPAGTVVTTDRPAATAG